MMAMEHKTTLMELFDSEFHILTVGNSLLSHFQQQYPEFRRPMHDHQFWEEVLDNRAYLEKLQAFLFENPARYSAEVNSVEAYLRRYHLQPHDVVLYIVGTLTPSNEFVRSAIIHYFKSQGFVHYTPDSTPAFRPTESLDEHEVFRRGLIRLLDHLVTVGRNAGEWARRLCFNPTGGYKAHVIVMGIAAFLTGGTLYYMHEEFREIIEFPPVFYYPTREELRSFIHFIESEDITREFDPDQMKRWIDFGLVALEINGGPAEKPRMTLTPRGKLWLEFFIREMDMSEPSSGSDGN